MARKRGFFAELQHQAAVAQREQQRERATAARNQELRRRKADAAWRRASQAEAAARRSDAKARAAAEREAKRLHVQAHTDEAEALNAALAAKLAEIDEVLDATLEVDDHVDLERLRKTVEHPPFTSKHEKPVPHPGPIYPPPRPEWVQPTKQGLFGKKKYLAELQAAQQRHADALQQWQAEVDSIPARQWQQAQKHAEKEKTRTELLAAFRATYDAECKARQEEVDIHNADLDRLIANLADGEKGAVEEYFSIVFSNSVYPVGLIVDVEHVYEPNTHELAVAIELPDPGELPTVRAYRYVKAKDEITHTQQSIKEQKDRYNALVHAIVLRTMHEAWESDRHGHVDSISLTASIGHIDPATGKQTTTPVAAAAVARADFEDLDLANITPVETLRHLKVDVSKNPHALSPISLGNGVRG